MRTLTFYNKDRTWGLKNYDITKVPSELYGAICKLKDYEKTGLTPEQVYEMDELYQDRLKETEELKRAAGSRWIPCSERLPKVMKTVLICLDTGWIDTGWYIEGSWWTGFSNEDEKKGVIAWRPLPEPYRTEECEE